MQGPRWTKVYLMSKLYYLPIYLHTYFTDGGEEKSASDAAFRLVRTVPNPDSRFSGLKLSKKQAVGLVITTYLVHANINGARRRPPTAAQGNPRHNYATDG